HRAARALDRRLENRGVGQIALMAPLGAGDGGFHEAGRRLVAAQQRIEHRIAIEARQAMPDVSAVAIDQAGNGAISDDAEIEAAHAKPPAGGVTGGLRSSSCSDAFISQARTCAGSPPKASATRSPTPPKRRAMLMPASSVISSPTKIGRRP